MRNEKKLFKALYIATAIIAGVGLICLIIKLVESLMRDVSPAWISTVTTVGIVMLAIALAMLIGIIVLASVLEKKNANNPKKSEEELLAQYKSNKNKK